MTDPSESSSSAAANAAAMYLAASGLGSGSGLNDTGKGAQQKKKDSNKKKKKKGTTGDHDTTKGKEKQSVMGKAIAERLAKQREEEEKIRLENEAIEAEERRREKEEAAEKKAEEEARLNYKRREAEKKAKKKADGSFKTKKQKEQEARAKAALDAMIAAGMEIPKSGSDRNNKGGQKKQKPVYCVRKKKTPPVTTMLPPAEVKIITASQINAAANVGEEEEKLKPSVDQHVQHLAEDDSNTLGNDKVIGSTGTADNESERVANDVGVDIVDDWESANVGELLGHMKMKDDDEKEEKDLIEEDIREEQLRLREVGIRREKMEAERKLEEEELERRQEEEQRKWLAAEIHKENCRKARLERENKALANRSPDLLRCPVGKTKLLDKIRQTSVQEGEAGGITQQIGATFFSQSTLKEKVQRVADFFSKQGGEENAEIRLPGILVIDTPGHESFSNLRSRGSTLCDLAILVIDVMHGLEQQTIESLNLLRSKNTPFVVALNKVDRCYDWKSDADGAIQESLRAQAEGTVREFHDRASQVRVELMEKGLNAELYWNNDDPKSTVSLVPTSAHTGEGIPDLIWWLTKLVQDRMTEKIMYMPDYLQCTVLEVKNIEGLGTTIDVIIVNGALSEGDRIVVCTMDGPVVTSIRALLTPPPSRELRVKSEYIHHKHLKGAIGAKICAPGIEKAIAGTMLMMIGPEDDEGDIQEEVMKDFNKIAKMNLQPRGVAVQASTLGALEALLQFLQNECDPAIPVCSVNIGTIFKKDVLKASIMLEKGKPEYATILAFDVKVDPEARSQANELNVRIFTADIIYHLFDQFTTYMEGFTSTKREEAKLTAVFPCVCTILKDHIFNRKDPIILGMEVKEGSLRVGTPLCIPSLELDIGVVTSIENNHREVPILQKGQQGAVRIQDPYGGLTVTYGRAFDASHGDVVSRISRSSIEALRENFRDKVTTDDLKLLKALKKVFNVP